MKRFFAFLLLIVLILTLCACGKSVDYSTRLEKMVGRWQLPAKSGIIEFRSNGTYHFTSNMENHPDHDGIFVFDDQHDLLMVYPYAGSIIFNDIFQVNSNGEQCADWKYDGSTSNFRLVKLIDQ